MPRRLTALLLFLAGCAASGAGDPGPVVAQGAQMWQGTIRCDAIPGFTTIPLVQPLTVEVQGGQARYAVSAASRPVFHRGE